MGLLTLEQGWHVVELIGVMIVIALTIYLAVCEYNKRTGGR